MNKHNACCAVMAALVGMWAAGECGAQGAASGPAPAEGAGVAAAPAAKGGVERWKGEITLPNGQALEFSVSLARGAKDGEGATGTLSIPMQGINEMALKDVVFEGAKGRFTLGLDAMPKEAWPSWEVVFGADGESAAGELVQGGMRAPVKMTKLKEGEKAGPKRPQEPVAPFPYTSREVGYENGVDGAHLAGTLTVPEGKGPHPAVVLITGSGTQDRDEALLGHKPFLVIADYLSRRGIAVLRVDDRGIGGSTMPKKGEETTDDFVGDVLAGVEFLKKQPEVDAKRIGLIGHSEGGVIAPMAAAKSADVSFIVLLAGTGVPGDEVLMEQLPAGVEAAGAPPEAVQAVREAAKGMFEAMKKGDSVAARAGLEAVLKAQMGVPAGAPTPAEAAPMVEGMWKEFEGAWMKRFLALDPREALRRVKVPTLALNGALDKQVLAKQNLPEIRKALGEAGNTDVTAEELPGLNHLFQTAKTGGGNEYPLIEETFAPAALEKMAAWVCAHAGVAQK